jgi:hypothetical protein
MTILTYGIVSIAIIIFLVYKLVKTLLNERKNNKKDEIILYNKLLNNYVKNPKIFVLCGGKCGSTSLQRTFLNLNYETLKIHGHEDFKKYFEYDGLINLINDISKIQEIYIIDSYRTPIERKISSFFENQFESYKTKDINEVIKIFNNKFLYHLENYHPLETIMDELKVKKFTKFDFNKSYNIKKVNNITFIKILYNDISKWNAILSKIFNKEIKICKENTNVNKLYNLFKEKYRVPRKYINNVLKHDKEFKFYNTKKDQKIYIDKWTKLSYD